MLKIENLSASYGKIEVLHRISLWVEEGEMVAILGANGAGKSTTLMSIMRLPPPEGPTLINGSIYYKGASLLRVQPHHVVSEHKISLVPEGRRIFGNITVLENLKVATYSRRDKECLSRDYEKIFSLFPRLKDRKDQRADTLSGGEQQMLAIGRAFISGSKCILLDEPSMGLAPLIMQELFRAFKGLNEDGTTIIIVEQNANMALKFAKRAYLMESGRIVMEGTAKELAKNPAVKRAYLG